MIEMVKEFVQPLIDGENTVCPTCGLVVTGGVPRAITYHYNKLWEAEGYEAKDCLYCHKEV